MIVEDFTAGINLVEPALAEGLRAPYYAIDVEPNGHVGLHRREAVQQYITASVSCPLFWSYAFNAVYSSAPGGFIQQNGGNVGSGYTNFSWSFVEAPAASTPSASTRIYAANPVDTPQRSDTFGTNFTNWTAATGTVPKGQHLVYAAGRIYMAIGTTVYASAPGDPYNWGTAPGQGFTVTVDSDDGDKITGLAICGPYLAIFKRRSTYIMYDLDSGANRCISRTIGAENSSATITCSRRARTGTYFFDRHGIYYTDGVTITNIGAPLGVDSGLLCTGLAYQEPFLLVTHGTESFVFDERLGAWFRHSFFTDGYGPTSGTLFGDSAYFLIPLQASGGGARYVGWWRPKHEDFTATIANDSGWANMYNGVTPTWRSGRFTFSYTYRNRTYGSAIHKKRLRGVGIEGSGALALNMYRDDPAYATPLTRAVTLPTRQYSFGTAKAFAWAVAGTGLWKLDSATFTYQERRD